MRTVYVARLLLVIASACAAHLAQGASAPAAANYPTKPIRLIVPFAPGGTNDILGRKIVPVEIAKWTKVAIAANMPRE